MPFLLSIFLTISFWMGANPGGVIEEGTWVKNAEAAALEAGKWIISNDEKDVNLKEIGGYTGGPTIISFENRTVELC
ncbi:MAG: hypothetical protein HOM43_02280 [Flavobacteriales bacterium]|nr:hypothetical protein [Flavobacteriales bacterium]